jgi:drug/metabolite transporter (DMT)-like permease
MILVILGAALIAGGIVAYRGSSRTVAQTLGVAAVAAGATMWAIVIVTIPVSATQNGSPEPTLYYQEHTR